MNDWPKKILPVKSGDFVRMRIRTSLDSNKIGIVSSNENEDKKVVVYWIIGAKKFISHDVLDIEEVYSILLEKVEECDFNNALDDMKPQKYHDKKR